MKTYNKKEMEELLIEKPNSRFGRFLREFSDSYEVFERIANSNRYTEKVAHQIMSDFISIYRKDETLEDILNQNKHKENDENKDGQMIKVDRDYFNMMCERVKEQADQLKDRSKEVSELHILLEREQARSATLQIQIQNKLLEWNKEEDKSANNLFNRIFRFKK